MNLSKIMISTAFDSVMREPSPRLILRDVFFEYCYRPDVYTWGFKGEILNRLKQAMAFLLFFPFLVWEIFGDIMLKFTP